MSITDIDSYHELDNFTIVWFQIKDLWIAVPLSRISTPNTFKRENTFCQSSVLDFSRRREIQVDEDLLNKSFPMFMVTRVITIRRWVDDR